MRSDASSEPHDLSRYSTMFLENETKYAVDDKVGPSSPYDSCSEKQSTEGINDAPKKSQDCILSSSTTPHSPATTPHSSATTPHSSATTPHSSATTPHSSAAVTPTEKSSSLTTVTSPCLFPSLHQLNVDKLEQYHEQDIRLQQQQQQQQQQQPPGQHHKDHEIDVCQHDRGQSSDSDSSSVNGRMEGHNRSQEFKPEIERDDVYWEKRRKNNEAARKSREKRRINDIMLAGRINVLEEDNSRLRRELGVLKHKFTRPDVRDYGNSMQNESVISGVIDKISSKCLNKNKIPRQDSFMGTLGKSSSHLPYSSPPPLLAVADAMSLYSSGCNQGFPYILPDATSLNQNGCLDTASLPFLTGMQHYHDLRSHQMSPLKDPSKHERIEEDKVLARERGSNNIDSTSAFHLETPQAALFRRGGVGNYSQYRNPLSVASSDVGHHPYFNCNIIQASHVYHLQHAYDSHPLLQNSPIPDLHNNINYDEPLQLTLRRDCCLNNKHNNNTTDDNSRETASNAALGKKPAASASSPVPSYPLKLRYKAPTQHIAYPGGIFPTTMPAISSGLSPQSYPDSCFLKGVNLSEVGLLQTNPVSLVTAELAAPYARGKDGIDDSRKNSLETKYFDPKYLERRRRNNEAARKCRENRKSLTQIKEAQSCYLETENSKLRVEMTGLHQEMKQLKELIEKKTVPENTKEDSGFIEY